MIAFTSIYAATSMLVPHGFDVHAGISKSLCTGLNNNLNVIPPVPFTNWHAAPAGSQAIQL